MGLVDNCGVMNARLPPLKLFRSFPSLRIALGSFGIVAALLAAQRASAADKPTIPIIVRVGEET
jgi:hypothetical protein